LRKGIKREQKGNEKETAIIKPNFGGFKI